MTTTKSPPKPFRKFHLLFILKCNFYNIFISLQQDLENKGYEEWVGEMIGMREILRVFANVSRSDITGMRAPFLKPGRNAQFEVIEDFGFIYDSSIGVPPSKIPIWPYTLDYKIPHDCKAGTCPSKSFPGIYTTKFKRL